MASRREATGTRDEEPSPGNWPLGGRLLRPLRAVREYLTLDPEPPTRFSESLEDLVERLQTDDEQLASELLSEAEVIFAEPTARIESAERRATTLQGSVAIAATVALAGTAVVLNADNIQGAGWRAAFAVGLGIVSLTLVAAGLRALGATSKVFQFRNPAERITERARLPLAAARVDRAADLLKAYGHNHEIARVKVGYLRAAAWWFRWALALFAAFVALVVAYVIAGPEAKKETPKGEHPTRSSR